MICEPLADTRETVVTATRTAMDFATLVYFRYALFEKKMSASFYKVFSLEEARKLTDRFEWNYTPEHGSWLDMAEIEFGILCRQALANDRLVLLCFLDCRVSRDSTRRCPQFQR